MLLKRNNEKSDPSKLRFSLQSGKFCPKIFTVDFLTDKTQNYRNKPQRNRQPLHGMVGSCPKIKFITTKSKTMNKETSLFTVCAVAFMGLLAINYAAKHMIPKNGVHTSHNL